MTQKIPSVAFSYLQVTKLLNNMMKDLNYCERLKKHVLSFAESSAAQLYGSIYHVVDPDEDLAVSCIPTDNGLSSHNHNLRNGLSALAATREGFPGGRVQRSPVLLGFYKCKRRQ